MHHGLPVLDVVFVKLVNPPMPVILGTLPVNVVPITPINSVFSCTIADTDTRVTVDRYQIPILPNFAMTDFASQGKTRTPNVVDLTHCRSHQSFYTCLSRGTSAASTVILKDFKTRHITEGATGWLWQELRALDILDEITKRRYEGKLSATVAGTFRVPLIRSFRKSIPLRDLQAMGSIEDLQTVDNNLLSGMGQVIPSRLDTQLPDPTDHSSILETSNNIDDSRTTNNNLHRVRQIVPFDIDVQRPLVQTSGLSWVETPHWGTVWDSTNNSCAYDTLLSMLFNMWNETKTGNGSAWPLNGPPLFNRLIGDLEHVGSPLDLVDVRDAFRLTCHTLNPNEFQWGPYLTDIFAVLGVLCSSPVCGEIFQACPSCGCRTGGKSVSLSHLVCPMLCMETNRDKLWISQALLCSYLPEFDALCRNCSVNDHQCRYPLNVEIAHYPSVLFVDTSSPKVVMDLSFDVGLVRYKLRGIIYHGNAHFTARFLLKENEWWYHDDITSGSYCVLDSVASNALDLSTVDSTGATAAVALYVRQ